MITCTATTKAKALESQKLESKENGIGETKQNAINRSPTHYVQQRQHEERQDAHQNP
jgi:hypothetical protein